MRVAIAASGGGHTGYAIAIAEQLAKKKIDVIMIVDPSDKWSIEKIRLRLGDSIDLAFVKRLRRAGEKATAIARRIPVGLASILRERRLFNEIDLLVCTGSNHSLLPAAYAKLAGTPVLCIEAVDRITTRSKTPAILHDLLGATIILHWPKQRKNYRRGVVVGPIYEQPRYKPAKGDYILVITGTEGHPQLVRKLLATKLQNIVLQTGRLIDPQLIARLKPGWKAIRYHPDIAALMSKASLVIAHQGLSIVEAALAYKKPVLLAHNPELHLTSSYKDAQELAKHLNTKAINPIKLSPQQLEKEIQEAMERKPPEYPPGAPILANNLRNIVNNKY